MNTEKLQIDTRFIPAEAPLPAGARQKMEAIAREIGPPMRALTVSPNWSHNNPLSAPTGFTLRVRPGAPLTSAPFSAENFFSGSIVHCLDSEKSGIRTADVVRNYQRHIDEMNRRLDVESFAGLYYSQESDAGYTPKKRYYLLVHTGAREVSKDLWRHIDEVSDELESADGLLRATKKEHTWEGFFGGGQVLKEAAYAASNNRKRLLSELAVSVGVADAARKFLSATVETPSYNIGHDPSTDSYSYHSATVDPSVSKGIILNVNPYIGSVILHGPRAKPVEMNFGASWSAGSNGFPISTGRLKSERLVLKEQASDWQLDCDQIHFAKHDDWRLAGGLYRLRNQSFKAAERAMNYDHTWGETCLTPILVKNH